MLKGGCKPGSDPVPGSATPAAGYGLLASLGIEQFDIYEADRVGLYLPVMRLCSKVQLGRDRCEMSTLCPVWAVKDCGRVPNSYPLLEITTGQGGLASLAENTLLSGGSSVGIMDVTIDVCCQFPG